MSTRSVEEYAEHVRGLGYRGEEVTLLCIGWAEGHKSATNRLRAGIEALASEWEADAVTQNGILDNREAIDALRGVTKIPPVDVGPVARHARIAYQHAAALRALLSADDEKAGA